MLILFIYLFVLLVWVTSLTIFFIVAMTNLSNGNLKILINLRLNMLLTCKVLVVIYFIMISLILVFLGPLAAPA